MHFQDKNMKMAKRNKMQKNKVEKSKVYYLKIHLCGYCILICGWSKLDSEDTSSQFKDKNKISYETNSI